MRQIPKQCKTWGTTTKGGVPSLNATGRRCEIAIGAVATELRHYQRHGGTTKTRRKESRKWLWNMRTKTKQKHNNKWRKVSRQSWCRRCPIQYISWSAVPMHGHQTGSIRLPHLRASIFFSWRKWNHGSAIDGVSLWMVTSHWVHFASPHWRVINFLEP